jgi:hypothetical protein
MLKAICYCPNHFLSRHSFLSFDQYEKVVKKVAVVREDGRGCANFIFNCSIWNLWIGWHYNFSNYDACNKHLIFMLSQWLLNRALNKPSFILSMPFASTYLHSHLHRRRGGIRRLSRSVGPHEASEIERGKIWIDHSVMNGCLISHLPKFVKIYLIPFPFLSFFSAEKNWKNLRLKNKQKKKSQRKVKEKRAKER